MSDEELVACFHQRPIERAWERCGERYGCHLVAGVFVIWFGYINRPIPWYGPLALLCLYLFIALAACFFLFVTPACVRVLHLWHSKSIAGTTPCPSPAKSARRIKCSRQPIRPTGSSWFVRMRMVPAGLA